MPVHRVKGGWRWGRHGHVYKTRRGAEVQARAAYANGYRGDSADEGAPSKLRRRLRRKSKDPNPPGNYS